MSVHAENDVIEKIQHAAAKAYRDILATDPDREGEAIAWHIKEVADLKKSQSASSSTSLPRTLSEEALSHPRAIDENLRRAQEARRVLEPHRWLRPSPDSFGKRCATGSRPGASNRRRSVSSRSASGRLRHSYPYSISYFQHFSNQRQATSLRYASNNPRQKEAEKNRTDRQGARWSVSAIKAES